jgi:hypothetical protein
VKSVSEKALILQATDALDLLDLARVGFVGFHHSRALSRAHNFVRMLDFCWISRRVERMFASSMTAKTSVDLRFY